MKPFAILFFGAAGIAALVLALALPTTACGLTTPQAMDVAKEAATVGCIIANAALPDEKAIATACQLSEDLFPLIRRTVAEHRAGVERAVRYAQAHDGALPPGYRPAYGSDGGGK